MPQKIWEGNCCPVYVGLHSIRGSLTETVLQAIARSHRIGQTKEVRVIHFEAVADTDEPSVSQQEQKSGQVRPPLTCWPCVSGSGHPIVMACQNCGLTWVSLKQCRPSLISQKLTHCHMALWTLSSVWSSLVLAYGKKEASCPCGSFTRIALLWSSMELLSAARVRL